MKRLSCRKGFETSENYQKMLFKYSKLILYVFLIFGINICPQSCFKVVNSTSKLLSFSRHVARLIFNVYRAVVLLLVATFMICCLDWIYNMIKICDIEKCIRFVSLSSAICCSAVTYLYIFYKQDSISSLFENALFNCSSQTGVLSDTNVYNKVKLKTRIISIAFFLHTMLSYLLCIGVSFAYLLGNRASSLSSFTCAEYSGFLIVLGCECYQKLASATVFFSLCFFIPFTILTMTLFSFVMFVLNLNLDIFTSSFTNVNGIFKLHLHHYVTDLIERHKEFCKIIASVNCSFSFLVFFWFVIQIFGVICLLRVSTDRTTTYPSIPFVLLIICSIHFLTMCFLAASVNSKVS